MLCLRGVLCVVPLFLDSLCSRQLYVDSFASCGLRVTGCGAWCLRVFREEGLYSKVLRIKNLLYKQARPGLAIRRI